MLHGWQPTNCVYTLVVARACVSWWWWFSFVISSSHNQHKFPFLGSANLGKSYFTVVVVFPFSFWAKKKTHFVFFSDRILCSVFTFIFLSAFEI